jgi:hypothetical protein
MFDVTDVFVLEPFVNDNFGHGWALNFAPIMSAHWNAAPGQEWTVPVGLGVTRTTVFAGRPISWARSITTTPSHPDAADQQLRFVLSLLYLQ